MSTATTKVSLPEICELVTDGTHDSPKLQPSGVPFIKGKHISSGRIDFANCDYITEQDHLKCIRRVKPQTNDVLFTNIGSVGDAARVPDDTEFSIKNVALFRPNPEKVDPPFFYYLVISPYFRGHFLNVRSGSAQPFISLENFRSLRFNCLQDRTAQQRIGHALSAYDDLIENNRRRIQLLEQAARLLYKEWFVHLRFPGHEHVTITDGVPEGWEKKPLGDIADTNVESYKARGLPDEINYIDISSVAQGRIVTKNAMLSSDAPGRARRKATPGDVIWSNVRPNLRAYALVIDPEENDVFSTGFTVLSPVAVPFSYFYLLVTTDEFIGHLVNHATGASYPAVRPDDFERAIVLIPSKVVLELFHERTEPIYRLISVFAEEANALTKARDLLLPRLMNGEVTV